MADRGDIVARRMALSALEGAGDDSLRVALKKLVVDGEARESLIRTLADALSDSLPAIRPTITDGQFRGGATKILDRLVNCIACDAWEMSGRP